MDKKYQDWPLWLNDEDVELKEYLHVENITNDNDYEEFRYTGTPDLVASIDLKRLLNSEQTNSKDDPIGLLKISPLWLRFVQVNDFPTTVRVKNVMTHNGITLVGDLLDYTSSQLLKFQFMGRKSLFDLSESILDLAKQPAKNVTANGSFRKDEVVIWYSQLLEDIPAIRSIFSDNLITSEKTYLEERRNLPEKLVSQIDEYRYNFLKDTVRDENPLELLKIAPVWLLDMNIKYFHTNQRTKNVITEQNIGSLKQFLDYRLVELSRMKNMGAKSIRQLHADILHAKKKGPPPTFENPLVDKLTLRANLENTIHAIKDEKHKFIMEARIGLNREPETLESIAEKFDLTRERVRQIQKKVTQSIIDDEFWDDSLKFKIQRLLQNQSNPIILEELHHNDPWFEGFQNEIELLKNVISSFSHLDVNFISYNNQTILSDLSQETFDNITRQITDNLEETIDVEYSYEDIEAIIENELSPLNGEELSDIMFEIIARQLNFKSQDGQLILASVGNGRASRLKAILEESDIPLHYTDIRLRYQERFDTDISDRNIHTALNHYKFWLFGRGVFGLQNHLPQDKEGLKKIAALAAAHIEANPKKQWHSTELLKYVRQNERITLALNIDKYVMNICLKQFSDVTYLGKMIWTSSKHANSEFERIQIKDAVIAALDENGGPMNVKLLADQIRKKRGLPANLELQLQAMPRVGKTAPGIWGLIYRDFGESEAYWNNVLVALLNHLNNRDTAIHKTELLAALDEQGVYPIPKLSLAYGIIQSDDRFRGWIGGFIGLREWTNPNRLTLREAAKQLADRGMDRFSLSEFEAELRASVSYTYKKMGLSVVLNNLGFEYDKEDRIWTRVSS